MANETMLNSDVANANATVLNTAVNSNATVLNTDIVSSVEIQKGTVLCDDYIVNGKLDIPTGEADLYLCTKKRQTYAISPILPQSLHPCRITALYGTYWLLIDTLLSSWPYSLARHQACGAGH